MADSGLDRLARDMERGDRTIRALRLEIITLETEVGDLCKRVQRLESELKLLRGGSHASD